MYRSKTSLFLILFLSFTHYGVAQFASFSAGYNCHFASPEGLNYIVDRYNETRPQLTEQMEQFTHLDGFCFSTFLGAGIFGLDFGYDHRSQNRSAMGLNRINQPLEREVRVAINTGNFGLYTAIPRDNDLFAIGSRVNFGGVKVKSRLARTEVIEDEEWTELYQELYADFDINLKYIRKNLAFEVYYLIGGNKNIAEVNEKLNPDTYQNDPAEINFRPNGFGVKLKLAFTNM